ncbi:coiled-coil domain-containing protein 30 isoform X2 [Bufo gargarizans]|uniref:coiled-coil domain-containing protein 30 isoform X2 n=1 Tax=Bufo gargarizans TaxID=30331 RepID=UPI001CF2AA75|nr:coiled-coil domain-containing protein 30 isoform X2 [Bufo gargarizans]
MDKVHVQSEDIVDKLKEKGFDPGTSTEEYLCFLWDLYQIAESKLQVSTNSLEELKLQQAQEMKEVESYVAHIRSLTEEREALTTDFEKENIQLRIELEKLQIQQDSQLKEVEEMLDQEGLNEIAHSSPSEQIAYLLVERATLLEKLELLEHKVDSRSEHLSDQRQDELEQMHRTLEEELYQQQETMRRTKETLNKTFDEELDKERKMRASVERDLTEAAQRLKMAHDEIRKLTDDLLIKKKELNELEQIMQKKQEDNDALQQELKDLRDNDSFELQKAKEHNSRLDKEILALRQRVRSLDSERKKHMEQCEKSNSDSTSSTSAPLNLQDNPELHKKCKLEVEGRECQNKLLQHKLQKLHSEYDDIVERNEELESILGETQNRTKEQVDYLECEIAGLQRTIMNLEAELTEMAEQREIKEEMLASAQKESADLKKMSNLQQELETLKTKLKEVNKNLKSKEQENYNLRVKNEQLEREAHLQDSKVSELQGQCKKLQMEISGQKPSGDVKQTHQQLQDKIKTLEKERETMSSAQEYKKKCEILQRQFQEEMEEVRSLREENLQLRQEVTAARQDLQSKREENSRFRQEVSRLQDLLSKPPDVGNEAKPLTGNSLIQQQYEEIRQLRQDLHRVQNVCSSAEKELRYERDKNLDIKKQQILLQKENTKLTAELNQVKQKLAAMTATCTGLEVDLEQRQHVMKEMELQLLKRTQTAKSLCSWQERLEHEKCRAVEAEKLVLELEQQLRASRHQVLLLETQNAERRHLEEELKKTRENEAKLKVQLQDEQLKRKILDQNFEELKLEMKGLHDKEISLTQNNCALQLKLHQSQSLRQHMDDEKMSTTAERTHLESSNQKLLEELSQVQEEKEQLHKEYDKLSKQLDDYIRKYNERQLRYKAKLSQAKEIHLSEGNQKDLHIKQLEMELAFSRSQAEKEQQWISRITADNENLHQEKRHLLQKIAECEASDRNHKWKLLSVQNRADILDEENRQLQESLLQLYNQVASLERVLKKLQSLNLADITKVMTPECLLRPDAILNNSPSEIEPASSPVMSEVIDATKLQQSPEIPMTLSLLDTLEVGYLNVASPGIPNSSLEPPVTPEPCTDNV